MTIMVLSRLEWMLIVGILVCIGVMYKLFHDRRNLIKGISEMNQALVSTTRADFNNDLEALKFLISYKVRVLDNQIRLSKIGNRSYLYEFDAEKERIVASIFMELSPTYKSIMSKYFTEKGLLVFISYSVYMELIEIFRKNHLGTPTTISDWVEERKVEQQAPEYTDL